MFAQLRSRLSIFKSPRLERLRALCTLAHAVVYLALSFCLASCAALHPIADSKATLWRVRGDHNTLYLLGSIHVMSKRAYPLKPVIEHAFDNANAVVFEIDLDRVMNKNFKEEFSRTAVYPPGQSLSRHLSPETIDVLNTILPVYGLSLKKVERFKPWFLAEVLSTRTLEMAGFSNDLGVDLHFYRKARAVGKPVLGLETVRDQARIFDRMDD
ncbi:MAG: TraB/GumN family protein, partial [Verrucomicrobia bacterium]|nr:TraB/GumN family protein [Verrucomicrobiota bacterium]